MCLLKYDVQAFYTYMGYNDVFTTSCGHLPKGKTLFFFIRQLFFKLKGYIPHIIGKHFPAPPPPPREAPSVRSQRV